MKPLTIHITTALLLAACWATPLLADDDTDHNALRELKSIYEKAASEGKPEMLKEHLDPEFTGVMVTGETVSSFKDIKEYWEYIQGLLGAGGSYKVTVDVAENAYIDGNLAISRGTTKDIAVTGGGKEFKFNSSWTAVCRKVDGKWKILRIQGSMNPIDNPFVAEAMKWSNVLTGVVSGLGGLVLGCLGVVLWRRRKGKKTEDQKDAGDKAE